MSRSTRPKPFALILLDGYALNPNHEGNAVFAADTPCLDHLFKEYPNTTLCSFGERVGLPPDQMGNSEVGHLNIGGGRVVKQDLLRIQQAIGRGELSGLAPLKEACQQASAGPDRALHFIGLVSQGGVHSDIDHLQALVREALEQGVLRIFIHCITDGRDRPMNAAKQEAGELESFLEECRGEYPGADLRIATLVGRYFAMDRDKRWERIRKAYDLFTLGRGEEFEDLRSALEDHYRSDQTDEFHQPVFFNSDSGRRAVVQDGDSLLFFNFRADRMRQILPAFFDEQFDGFVREAHPKASCIVTLTQYDPSFPVQVLFPPQDVPMHFGDVLAKAGLRQLRIAETEKYPHVTYFFNGGVETPVSGEDRIVVPSKRDVPTYDLVPEMSAPEITNQLCGALQNDEYDVVIVNYANGDMVGHTGNFDAAVKAIETVDSCLQRVIDVLLEKGGAAIVTADHGNADQMIDYETGEIHTYHTKHPVPFILIGTGRDMELQSGGALCDIAPTALDVLGLDAPEKMTGDTLIKRRF